uniref:Uncharacterized protein n=1 Tax=Opuntia streptacantha TaxID=393608 RepID=A0A7C8ZME0_OPUST
MFSLMHGKESLKVVRGNKVGRSTPKFLRKLSIGRFSGMTCIKPQMITWIAAHCEVFVFLLTSEVPMEVAASTTCYLGFLESKFLPIKEPLICRGIEVVN